MTADLAMDGGLTVASARFLTITGLVAGFGSLLYLARVAPAGLAPGLARRLRRLAWGALAWAGAGVLLWLLAQTADLAGDLRFASLATVLAKTWFGHAIAAQLACLALAAAALNIGRPQIATVLAGAALGLQAAHGHALAMGGETVLLAASALHLLAAGAWLGGLVPLFLVMQAAPAPLALQAARRFSPFGMVCVAGLLGTAALQFQAWIGDVPSLVGTLYGRMAALKMLLFAALIGLAARNRLVHTPSLAGSGRPALMRAIVIETGIGLAVLLAAAILSQLPPPMHQGMGSGVPDP